MITPPLVPAPTFVGRTHELGTLGAALDSTLDGRRGVVVMAGEAGIGKSHLLGRLLAMAHGAGVPTVVGSCWEIDRTSPLAPLVELLGEEAPPVGDTEPGDGFGFDSRPDGGAYLQRQKRRFFATLLDRLDNLFDSPPGGEGGSVVMAIEDIHWCDETTLEFLPYLMSNSRHTLLLAVTMRPEEADLPLAGCLAALERLRLVTELVLAPLSDSESSELVRAVLGRAAPRGDRLRQILDLADGNPLFIEELARSIGPARPGPGSLDGVRIPHSVAVAVKHRTAGLEPELSRLVEVASVLGRRFEFALLCGVGGIDEEDAVPMVRRLRDAGLLVEESADLLAFRHALIQTAIAGELLARERSRLHRVAASIIIDRAETPSGEQLAQLAHHCYEAGDWEQTLKWAKRACSYAVAMYTPRAAAEHATRAIEASGRLGFAPSSQLLRARGLANEWAGSFEAARSDHQMALERARAENDRAAVWRSLIDLGALSRERDFTRAGELFDQALVIARDLDDRRALARTLSWIGFWEMMNDDPLTARGHQEEALEIFEALGDDEGIAETVDHLGWTYYVCADLPASNAAYERAAALKRRLDDPPGLAGALAGRATGGTDYFQLPTVWPQLDEVTARRDAEDAVRYASGIAWRSGEARAQIWTALFLGVRGHFDPALAAARRGLDIARQDEQVRYLATAHIALGALWLDLLRIDDAVIDLERALVLSREMGSPTVASTAVGFLVSARLARGEVNEAAGLLGPHHLDLPVASMPQRLLGCAHVEVALAEEEPELALALVDRIVAASRNLTPEGVVPRLWQLRGEALAQLGRWQQATESLDSAATAAAELGQRGLLWRILVGGGKVEQLQRRTRRAAENYDQARGVVESLAATLGRQQDRADFVAAVNARIPGIGSAAVGRELAAGGLTRRESEVAALVADGLTNREIADQLVISRRTVEKHVENVLMKLGLRSRVQVAVWFVDHAAR